MRTTLFICQLPQRTQEAIKKDIENYLKSEGFEGQKFQEILRNALDGRLVDLEECIDISKYIEEVKQMQTVKTFTKADNGKLSKVVEYESGERVEIPINKDGSVRWFDDNKLLKASTK